jgi:hypothetical protein
LSKIAIFSAGFSTRPPTKCSPIELVSAYNLQLGEPYPTQKRSHEVWWKMLAKCVLGRTDGQSVHYSALPLQSRREMRYFLASFLVLLTNVAFSFYFAIQCLYKQKLHES